MEFNDLNLNLFLHSEEGPVGQLIERMAARTADVARENAFVIMHRIEEKHPEYLDSITYEQEGITAVIGIEDGGSVSRYLADKEVREENWLKPALEHVADTVDFDATRRT